VSRSLRGEQRGGEQQRRAEWQVIAIPRHRNRLSDPHGHILNHRARPPPSSQCPSCFLASCASMASPTHRTLLPSESIFNSPPTPSTPLTPPLTPSSAVTSDSSPAHFALSPNTLPGPSSTTSCFATSSQLLRASKPNLPKIDTRKLAVSAQQETSAHTPLSYDLNSPTETHLPRPKMCGEHFVVVCTPLVTLTAIAHLCQITGVPSSVQLRALHQTFQVRILAVYLAHLQETYVLPASQRLEGYSDQASSDPRRRKFP
jgi:hypothetical protein